MLKITNASICTHPRNSTKPTLLRAVAIALIVIWTFPVQATPKIARQYKQVFGYNPSCNACHREGGGTPMNSYGEAFKEQGKSIKAFELIATLDSDGDGFSNADETKAKANPADAKSTPKAPGDWLDLSSLVPKEVQATFPEAEAWKPLDATLKDSDIQAASKMGVTLSAEDENTIYIPVANRRPIGTALIFPAKVGDETVYLLMSTDRQLNFDNLQLIETASGGATPNLDKLIAASKGKALNQLPQQSDQASVSEALRRAGVLVYLRLKGA